MLLHLFYIALALIWPIVTLQGLSLPSSLPDNIRIRQGKQSDELQISLTMAKELMNPFGISHKNNLLVACDVMNSQQLVGWAQIRSIGFAGVSNPNKFEDDASKAPTGQSRLSIEQEVDDLMWEEFEEDSTPIPNGLASLPWTEEYKAASRAADERVARRQELLQMELDDAPKLWELSSVYVAPEYRRQGVGSELVRQVISRQSTRGEQGRDVFALTLVKNAKWYEQFGFEVEQEVPGSMSFEVAAGNAITKMIGEELVCMKAQL